MSLNPKKIQEDVIRILRVQGYKINNRLIEFPKNATKKDFRRMNELAVAYRIKKAEPALQRYEEILLRHIANGEEVIPERVQPKLVYVNSGTQEALHFR